MFKTTVETLLRIKSIIKVNETVESVEPGEYAVHEMTVCFDRPHMHTKSRNVTYFLENLANSNRDDCLDETTIKDAMAEGKIEIVNAPVVSYKVEYTDLTDKQEKVDYVYVKAGFEGISNEYFETRVEREMIAESFNPIKLKYHDIKVHDYTLCLR